MQKVRDAKSAGDDEAVNAAVNSMLKLADRGATESQQWRELTRVCNGLANLKKVQAGIAQDHNAFLRADQAHEVLRVVATAVREALVLVRDQWRQLHALLTKGELDQLIDRMRAVGDGDDGWESELRAWHEQLREGDMTGSFKLADQVIQRRSVRSCWTTGISDAVVQVAKQPKVERPKSVGLLTLRKGQETICRSKRRPC